MNPDETSRAVLLLVSETFRITDENALLAFETEENPRAAQRRIYRRMWRMRKNEGIQKKKGQSRAFREGDRQKEVEVGRSFLAKHMDHR